MQPVRLVGQVLILVRHCLLTRCYYEPCQSTLPISCQPGYFDGEMCFIFCFYNHCSLDDLRMASTTNPQLQHNTPEGIIKKCTTYANLLTEASIGECIYIYVCLALCTNCFRPCLCEFTAVGVGYVKGLLF